ncbi:GNAT family N-acetyltransferase [Rhodobacteraceae bacterium SC52]|nr:GNAT family N-acetyltransferase [Rhodobacteraceae bacterium SC52]
MIRQAVQDDAVAVQAIAVAAYAQYVAAIGRNPAPMDADYGAVIAAGHVHVSVDSGGAVDGYVVFFPEDGAMMLDAVGVRPDATGRGLGRALISVCEDHAQAAGLQAVRLYTNAAMTANLAMYPRLGYRMTERRHNEGFDRVFFEKRLNRALAPMRSKLNEREQGKTMRRTTEADKDAVLALYPLAFPDEELRPLVDTLLSGPDPIVSLAMFEGGNVAAHVLFTICQNGKAALLGPLCVSPELQKQGLGSGAVRAGFETLCKNGVEQVFVLGDPAYYGRFGFEQERAVTTPCAIPADWAAAWQSLILPGGTPLDAGTLVVPKPWRDPALWAG